MMPDFQSGSLWFPPPPKMEKMPHFSNKSEKNSKNPLKTTINFVKPSQTVSNHVRPGRHKKSPETGLISGFFAVEWI